MADPSGLIDNHLLPHLHLLCNVKYPLRHQPLTIEEAHAYLVKAPQIVKEHSPVTWQFLRPQQNGTVVLAWQPVRLGGMFASDGFIWTSLEKSRTETVKGLTIEMYVQESGHTPQEPVACHRRVRFRTVASTDNQPFDPCLEIVQYTQALPEHQHPVDQSQIQQQLVAKQLSQRGWLEARGPPQRKEFMLHDNTSWPRIEMPRQQQGSNMTYQAGQSVGRPGMASLSRMPGNQQPFPPQQQSARPGIASAMSRRSEKSRVPGSAPFGAQISPFENPAIMDEDNTYGDWLDFVTPYDISATRFKQHHEWMEEVLSSPFVESQIHPVDFMPQFSGELAVVTRGIVGNKIDPNFMSAGDKDEAGLTPQDNVSDMEKRIAEFLKSGREELRTMEQAHTQKLEAMKRETSFAKFERRLARIPLDVCTPELDDFTAEVEQTTAAKFTSKAGLKCVQSGGILNAGEQPAGYSGVDNFADFTNFGSAGESLEYNYMDYTA